MYAQGKSSLCFQLPTVGVRFRIGILQYDFRKFDRHHPARRIFQNYSAEVQHIPFEKDAGCVGSARFHLSKKRKVMP